MHSHRLSYINNYGNYSNDLLILLLFNLDFNQIKYKNMKIVISFLFVL